MWEVFRTVRQISLSPVLTGGLALAAGYLWGLVRRVPRPLSPDLIAFHRREQMQRLSRFMRGSRSVVDDNVQTL